MLPHFLNNKSTTELVVLLIICLFLVLQQVCSAKFCIKTQLYIKLYYCTLFKCVLCNDDVNKSAWDNDNFAYLFAFDS